MNGNEVLPVSLPGKAIVIQMIRMSPTGEGPDSCDQRLLLKTSVITQAESPSDSNFVTASGGNYSVQLGFEPLLEENRKFSGHC
ncbi:MAG: hypothetical protein IPG90_04230 [Bacteroidetes bacterium]|nr:hypothetical protein [Bacteroidota bacterium]